MPKSENGAAPKRLRGRPRDPSAAGASNLTRESEALGQFRSCTAPLGPSPRYAKPSTGREPIG